MQFIIRIILIVTVLIGFRELMDRYGPNGTTPDPGITEDLIGYGFELASWYEYP